MNWIGIPPGRIEQLVVQNFFFRRYNNEMINNIGAPSLSSHALAVDAIASNASLGF